MRFAIPQRTDRGALVALGLAASVGILAANRLLGDGEWFDMGQVHDALARLAFDPAAFWTLFAALFAIMNPLVAVPMFVDITKGKTVACRRGLAFLASMSVMIALVVALILGEQILAFFAISLGAFRVSGGVVVLLMGLAMLKAEANSDRAEHADEDSSDSSCSRSIAICPIAIPLLAGPGAIATVIVGANAAGGPADYAMIVSVIASIVVVTFATLLAAVPIARVLGPTGIVVISRVTGMIVAAIALDMMIIGLKAAFPGML